MIITECNSFSGISYKIIMEKYEDIIAFDIAESFKRQYPKEKAVICFLEKSNEMKVGLLIVGLRLK